MNKMTILGQPPSPIKTIIYYQGIKKREMTQFAKMTLDFQKTMLDNSYNAMIMVQDQSEKMVSTYFDQIPWVTDEGKKSMQASVDMTKKSRDDFKKTLDDGFSKREDLLEDKKGSSDSSKLLA